MYAKTKMNWLKALALVAFSQFCFLVGTAQAHAEETTAIQPTMEAIAQVASEVTEVQPAEAGVPAGEATVEQAPVTEGSANGQFQNDSRSDDWGNTTPRE